MQPWVYLVILGIVIIGYAYMRPRDVESKRTTVIHDIETSLDQFAEELEEGNKELLLTVSGLKRELEAELTKLNVRLAVVERQISADVPQLKSRKVATAVDKQKDEVVPLNQKQEDIDQVDHSLHSNDIKNRYSAIIELHKQGKSIEYIAKKAGMNKGEVQLIIQLARQEEQFRV